ncbi:MAG: hypothetical protein WA667_19785 [Candidatus Nitrosopolaris sp.]
MGGTNAYAEFNTTAYNNANLSSPAVSKAAAPHLSPNFNPFNINPVYVTYGIIFAIPAAMTDTYRMLTWEYVFCF